MNYTIPVLGAEPGAQVDVVYFDFRQVFDILDNGTLSTELAAVGLTPH